MRIAFCNASKSWGGVKTWTIEFAAALQALGHHAIIIGRDERFITRAQAAGLEAYQMQFGADFSPFRIATFMRFFKKHNVEAVLVNVGSDIRTAGIAAALCKLPVIHRVGLPADMRNQWKVRLTHKIIHPHYLCPCRDICNGMRRILPFVRQEDCTVLYSAKMPIDEAVLKKRFARETTKTRINTDAQGAPLRLVTTSQLKKDKGHSDVLAALATLRSKGYALTWDVAGTGEYGDTLKAKMQELGLDDCITWHGFTQNIAQILQNSEVFVLPSHREGLPNTLLEALAQGLIPIARNVGGINEVWPKELAPYLLENENFSESLTDALEQLASMPQAKRHALRRAALAHCRAHLSLPVQAKKLEAFFAARIATTPK